MAKKKIYVCQICNTYLTKDANDAVPVCCGKEMIEMDELEESAIKDLKESSGGL